MTVYRCPDLARSFASIETQAAIYDWINLGCLPHNGDILLLGRRGTQHAVEKAGKIRKWVSSDNGSSWAQADIADSADHDDRGVGGGVIPATGTVMLFYARHDVDAGTDTDIRILRSTDHGANFTDLGSVSLGSDTTYRPFSNLVQLPSGEILQSFYGSGSGYWRAFIQYSIDDGLTWGSGIDIHNHAAEEITETSVIYVDGDANGAARLLAVARHNNGVLHQYTSTDSGAAWSDDGVLPFSHGSGLDVAPNLQLINAAAYLTYTDRTDDQMKYAVAPAADLIGDVTPWTQALPVYDSQADTDNNRGHTTLIATAPDSLHLVFADAPGADDCDVFHSF